MATRLFCRAIPAVSSTSATAPLEAQRDQGQIGVWLRPWSRCASVVRGAPRCVHVMVLTALVVLTAAVGARAQATSTEPPLGRVEAAFAAGWLSGAALADADANLRTRDGTSYRLFTTESRFDAAPMIEARLAYPLTRRYTVEGRFGFTRPELRTSISADVENAPALSVVERVDHYTIEGALIVMMHGLRVASLVPFVSGGAGYLRQLHEGQTLVEEGVIYHIGGGVKHQLFARPQGFLKAAGFRADGRVYLVTGGVELDAGTRPHAAASGGFYVTF
jgi:hypothetical protein